MTEFKTILYSDSPEKYYDLIKIIEEENSNVFCINNSLDFLKEVISSRKDITVVLIENDMIGKISASLSSILKLDNYFCVLLYKDICIDISDLDYIHDTLEINNKIALNSFIKRLKRNLNYRIKLNNYDNTLYKFYDIGKKLSAEKSLEKLLDLIIDYSMEITASDAATIYIIVDKNTEEWTFYEKNIKDKVLKFVISKNNTISLNLKSSTIEISETSIIGAAVLNGEPIHIDDAYNIPANSNYKFNKGFDEVTGYKTHSMLSIPMKDHENRVLGVIQLINKKENGEIVPFSLSDELVIYALAGQAAVVLENNMLYKNLNILLEKNRDIIAEEINKRKSADEEINKLLSAVEHSPVSVIITDADGRIEYVNPKFEKLTGYTLAEIAQKNPRIFKSGMHDKEYYKNLWSVILEGNDWQGELYSKKKNGEYYWANCYITSVKDWNGTIKYFIAVEEDVTEKKKLLSELEEKNNSLEETIKQLHLSQAQLIHSEKLAGIGQLAAGMAHEMNNPLSFVISNLNSLDKYFIKMKDLLLMYKNFSNNVVNSEYSNMLKSLHTYEKENKISFIIDDTSDVLNESKEGLLRVSDIIKALRSFSSIDQISRDQMYDLNSNINNTLIMLQNELGSYIKVHKDLGDVPLINVDAKEINQALLNLIKNAVYAIKCKFKTENKGVITIKTYSSDSHVFVEIEDNGIGVEEKYISKVYEPFFTTKPVGEGMGLGLSIAYDVIVKKHKGDLSFTTKYGIGTKFKIKLRK